MNLATNCQTEPGYLAAALYTANLKDKLAQGKLHFNDNKEYTTTLGLWLQDLAGP